ncbi:dynamin family protein [Desulfonema magnum]|uniref:Dynamin domain-containing protein n=1 Tax=Desulfonema magnum TaxID=45655 RepID=A0A975BUQ1_9BACT|nr:dynamin family protein [Desulfonema magnum]QTA91623.1 Dynamin domain-containing protein [Desulfonema magnum]
MKYFLEKTLNDALKKLRQDLPDLADILCLGDGVNLTSWTNVIDGKLLPRLSPDFPLMAAICGGGSSGKSTLFNSLVGDRLSPAGGNAGINRRILVSAPGEIFRQKEFLSTLFEPFGSASKPLKNKKELTEPGCPLYILNSNVPRNMVLMDTPDFDTGAQGGYVNRDVVRQALGTSDILIYVFTNSNYNNRDNTDFISEMLTGIGMRKCFLVYRVYAGFDNEEVIRHAMTVARNLYGNDAEKYVLGIYRSDEDNAVAAGERFAELKPVRDQDLPFTEALKRMDPRKLRPELLSSILKGTLETAEKARIRANTSLDELRLYLDALKAVQSQCVREALPHFPLDMVLKRFIEIWLSTDPPHIRVMRQTGNIFSQPIKMFTSAAGRAKDKILPGMSKKPSEDFKDKVEADLITVVNEMHRRTAGSEVSVSLTLKEPVTSHMIEVFKRIIASKGVKDAPYIDFSDDKEGTFTLWVSAHPVVFQEQETLRNKDWEMAIQSILSHKDVIIDMSENMENDLSNIVNHLRDEMGVTDRVRQTFSALLNVIPATAAVTYIFSTGDPVGAAGIKVKLAGLFGLHDLYALIAIPATTGMKRADQKQIEAILGPLAKQWLDEKLRTVQGLFEKEITGGIIRAAQEAISASDQLIKDIENSINVCGKAVK